MKRLFVVAGLLVVMLGVRALGSGDALTLAAIGFVILTSFALAELLARAGLPKVTGYILSGVVLGPSVGAVLSDAVVAEMRMFNTLAVGLIALTAGLELELAALRRLTRTLVATTIAKLGIAVPLVATCLIAIELTWHPLATPSDNVAVALGLVFGALAIGTSPAISLAIIAETKARGRLAELLLGSAVLKDLVVAILLALCIALADSLVAERELGIEVLAHVGAELGLSIVAGVAIGGLLIAYMRFIRSELLLFVAALVLVVAELAEAFRLELLLVLIVAGFVVRNLSHHEKELLPPLTLASLPVFVVFFTIAGASVQLDALLGVLPIALALCSARALGYWLAARVGNRIGGEAPPVAANAWLAYLPQAGVTLGLVGIAEHRLDSLAGWIGPLGMAVVAINLFVGPLTQRLALRRAGEVDDEVDARTPVPVDASASEAAPRESLVVADAALEARLRTLARVLREAIEPSLAAHAKPWLALRRRRFAALPGELKPAAIDELADNHPPPDALGLARTLASLFDRCTHELEQLDVLHEVTMEAGHWLPEVRESPARRLRRVLRHGLARVGVRRAGRRRVPLRLAARTAYEPRLASAMLELLRAAQRCDARVADQLRRLLDGSLAHDELDDAIAAVLDDYETALREIPSSALAAADRSLRTLAARIDSPRMALAELDYGEVAPAIERELAALRSEAEAWPAVADACWQSVAIEARVHVLHEQLAGGTVMLGELARAGEALDEELAAFERRLGDLRGSIDQHEGQAGDELLAGLAMRCRGLLPKPATKRLRQLDPRLRRMAELRGVRQAVRELFERESGTRALGSTELAASAAVPTRVRVRELDVRELIEGELSTRLLPRAQQKLELAAQHVEESAQQAATIVADVELLLEVYRTRESGGGELDSLRTSIERIVVRAGELRAHAREQLRMLASGIGEDFDALAKRLATAIDEATEGNETAHWVSRRADRARLRFVHELDGLRVRVVARLVALREQLASAAASLSEDYRLRAGRAAVSASEIAAMLPSPPTHLPREYAALFAEQPIRDPRFFVANREALRMVGKAERAWVEGGGGNGVLVLGGPGSGKTSLLSVAQLKLATREVLSLSLEGRALLDALALELRCPAREDLLVRRLRERKRVIVIDDLQRLLPPGPAAALELERLIGLIAASASTCFWLVAIERELQRLVEPLVNLRVAFAGVVALGEDVDSEALEQAVIARHRISGTPLRFPASSRVRALVARLPGVRLRSQERQFFVRLAALSRGNLRAALAEWCRRASVEGGALVLDPQGRSRGLPFVPQLPTPALGLLVTLLRFGPCRASELADALALAPEQLVRWLHFLAMAQLIAGDEHEGWHCPARIRDQLAPELALLGLFHPEQGDARGGAG